MSLNNKERRPSFGSDACFSCVTSVSKKAVLLDLQAFEISGIILATYENLVFNRFDESIEAIVLALCRIVGAL